MKKIITVSTLALLLSAGFDASAKGGFIEAKKGGFTGPSVNTITIAEAKELKDDAKVVLTGKIEKGLGDEKYKFYDETDSITIEIDDDDWKGLEVSPDDVIEIYGEVDKDLNKIEIDVDKIVKK